MSRPAVFMDRDGTLVEEHGYLDRLDLLSVFPWTADAVRLLNRAGFVTVVVTNQAAVAHGMIDEEFVAAVHRELDTRLGRARIDAYYYCPHHEDSRIDRYRHACACRKPQPGMIEQACAISISIPALVHGRRSMVGRRRAVSEQARVHSSCAPVTASARKRPKDGVRGRCYPQQFDGGRRVDSAQLLALIDALRGRKVAVIGDVVAMNSCYGRHRARVTRGAGADPRVRLDRGGRWCGRQCGEQRRALAVSRRWPR
jgi:histidinol-phosphate phosphatase family protein